MIFFFMIFCELYLAMMLSKLTLPILAILGFSFGVFTVVKGNQPTPIAQPVSQPADSPYQDFIAGAGLIEPRSQNIAIGTPIGGIVKSIEVKVGDQVKANQALFRLDDQEALAQLQIRSANLAKAKASVVEMQASVNEAQALLQMMEAVTDTRAISNEELVKRRSTYAISLTRLETVKTQVLQAEAELAAVQTTLNRLIIRAPSDAQVLQVNLRSGEFAAAGLNAQPLMLLGDLTQYHVRVDIDENDAWRFQPKSKAVAYIRGNRQFKADLQFVWVEPYVIPKKSLTGDSTERVDTRVLQALYRFDPHQIPTYIGQQMDVFIEVPKSQKVKTPSSAS